MKKLFISQIDTHFANGSYPIEFFFFYPGKIETTKIRKAIKTAAKVFWPLFGVYENGFIVRQKYIEEDCFTEKNLSRPFDNKQSEGEIFQNFSWINPAQLNKLFFLSVLQFPNGTALLPKMSHLAGDGYSYFYFLTVLSALVFNNNPFKKSAIRYLYKPSYKRTVFDKFRFEHQFEEHKFVKKDLTPEYLKFPKMQIKEQIKNSSSKFKINVSTNDILCAYILKKFAELNLFKEKIELTMPVDVRNRIKEYGSKFFGNGLLFNRQFYNLDLISGLPVEELAVEIRKTAPDINKENYLEYLSSIEKCIAKGEFSVLRPFDPERGCLVTNLSKLPTNKMNFGSGKPEVVSVITEGKNTAAILSENNDFILRIMY